MTGRQIAPYYEDTIDVKFDTKPGESYTCCLLSTCFCFSGVGLLCCPCLPYFSKKIMAGQSCKIDSHRINYKAGWLNKEDKLIPLDRIQDVNIVGDIVMRCFGLQTIRIETAGSGNPNGGPEAELIAPLNALELRNEIIARRDRLVHGDGGTPGESGQTQSNGLDGVITRQPQKLAMGSDLGSEGLKELKEIRLTLQRIEEKGRM